MNRTASSLVLAVALVSLAPLAPARAAAGPARGVRFRAGLWEIITSSEGANAR